ncbi:hypothetical protein [Vogesella sp. EB]|uniref:hypothetical protein n=1 Tax=Vogesella sp. EB TaxID=1526735 RepID=UPI0012E07294|nr:hypothetical protein [Vogesella sp. EB]
MVSIRGYGLAANVDRKQNARRKDRAFLMADTAGGEGRLTAPVISTVGWAEPAKPNVYRDCLIKVGRKPSRACGQPSVFVLFVTNAA